jgi:hypothetical protein
MNSIRQTDKIQLWTIKDFVSHEKCDQLVNEAYEKGFIGSAVQNSKKSMTTEARTSTTAFLKKSDVTNRNYDVTNRNYDVTNRNYDVTNRNYDVTDYFSNQAKEALKSLGVQYVDSMKLENLQVQKYEQGQKYNPHYDSFSFKDGSDQRSWTVMVYLECKELEGGSTYFPKIDLRITPEKAMAVVWNNLRNDYCRDENTLHTGTPVISGTKIIVTMWFHKPDGSEFLCKEPNFWRPNEKGEFLPEPESEIVKEIVKENFNPEKLNYFQIFILVIFVLFLLVLIYNYKNR